MSVKKYPAAHLKAESMVASERREFSSNSSLLTAIFKELESRSVSYCLLRNFEGLPEKAYGDVDVLVSKGDLPRVEMILKQSLTNKLFLFKKTEKNNHTIFNISSKTETIKAIGERRPTKVLKLDFVTGLTWNGIAYLDSGYVLTARQKYNDFYVAARCDRAIHLFYHALLDKNFFSVRYREKLEDYVSDDEDQIVNLLQPFVGRALAKHLYSALLDGDYDELLRIRKSLILRLLLSKPGSFPSLLCFILRKNIRLLYILLKPPGILVATAGPDGAGKSTILHEVGTVLNENFDPLRNQYMGWNQFVLPSKQVLRFIQSKLVQRQSVSANGGAADFGQPLSWTYNFSVLHYFIDLWARYLLKIRPVLVRGGLVLSDRYFYDVLARNVWISRNPWARSILLTVTPPPTVLILFTGNSEAITKRKEEISVQETERQLASFAVLKHRSGTVVELDAMAQLDENILTLLKTIF